MATHSKESMLADILAPLALHYPQAGYSPAHLSALADDWCEDLDCYPMDALKKALRMARTRERYFPCIAVFLGYVETVMVSDRASHLALSEIDVWDQERIAAAERWLPRIMAKLNGSTPGTMQ